MKRCVKMALALQDFARAAKRFLPGPLYGYVAGAAEMKASLADKTISTTIAMVTANRTTRPKPDAARHLSKKTDPT